MLSDWNEISLIGCIDVRTYQSAHPLILLHKFSQYHVACMNRPFNFIIGSVSCYSSGTFINYNDVLLNCKILLIVTLLFSFKITTIFLFFHPRKLCLVWKKISFGCYCYYFMSKGLEIYHPLLISLVFFKVKL